MQIASKQSNPWFYQGGGRLYNKAIILWTKVRMGYFLESIKYVGYTQSVNPGETFFLYLVVSQILQSIMVNVYIFLKGLLYQSIK